MYFAKEDDYKECKERKSACDGKALECRRNLARVFFELGQIHNLLQEEDSMYVEVISVFRFLFYCYV